MSASERIIAVLTETVGAVSPDEVDARVQQALDEHPVAREHLESTIAWADGEDISHLCPVVVDRRGDLTWSQRVLESPVVSTGWLVVTDRHVVYAGVVRRPTVHAWGGVAGWTEAPDHTTLARAAISSVEAGGTPAQPRLTILGGDGTRLIAEGAPGFEAILPRLATALSAASV